MAYLQDDEYLALAVLRLCDAHDERIDATQRQAYIDAARKNAHAVLNRGKRKPEPETTLVAEETD